MAPGIASLGPFLKLSDIHNLETGLLIQQLNNMALRLQMIMTSVAVGRFEEVSYMVTIVT